MKEDVKDDDQLEAVKVMNNFGFVDDACPFSAHIRKTNLRVRLDGGSNDPDNRAVRTRIIRNGIPYGPDYKGHENDGSTRGLLFACYQAHIEDGFHHMQAAWSNKPEFPQHASSPPGFDPIIGQVDKKPDGSNGRLKTFVTDKSNKPASNRELDFQQLVTLKGGGYFFVPPISALKGALAGP
jgi:deferrochelatase/peroxidase EfeB